MAASASAGALHPYTLALQAALYEQLLAGARQVFHRSTMEGRNQQKLNELRWGKGKDRQ
jgi:hypothetical protein